MQAAQVPLRMSAIRMATTIGGRAVPRLAKGVPATQAARVAADRWLSDLLGRPAWRVDADAADLADLLRATGPGFFYARVAAEDLAAVHRFEDCGFRIVDTTITLEASIKPLQADDFPDVPGASKIRILCGPRKDHILPAKAATEQFH